MARPRSPNRDKAYQLWLESGKTRQLKEIAAELGVSEEQVRKWKNKDQWDKVTLPNSKGNVTKQRGGQPGNQNAKGYGAPEGNQNALGHGAPEGNKNAVTTGEFETLFFDCLNTEEKQLVAAIPANKERLLMQEIQLLTVRERRMLKRINSLSDGYLAVNGHNIEDALTRVQARKQAAIDSLHRYDMDDTKLELELMRLELASLKIGGQEAGQEDDGFLDALNAEAGSLWGESDGD